MAGKDALALHGLLATLLLPAYLHQTIWMGCPASELTAWMGLWQSKAATMTQTANDKMLHRAGVAHPFPA